MKDKTIFLFFLLIYILFASGHYGGDGFYTYLTTESIVLDRNLVLNDYPEREFEISEMERVYNIIVNNTNKKVYSKYQLGQVIIQLPFYIIGLLISFLPIGIPTDYITMFFVSMSNCVISALLCMVFYKVLKLFSVSDRISILVTIAFGLCTYIFPHSRQGFREPLVALCILSGIYLIRKNILLSGIFIGCAIFTRFDTVYILPAFFLYILLVKEYNRIVYFIFPVMFFISLTLFINYLIRGNILTFGYQNIAQTEIIVIDGVKIITNIWGFFFSSGKSFFLYAPVTILFFWSIKGFIRKYRCEAVFFISIIVFNLCFFSLVIGSFHSGYSWGPRFQYAIIPFFLIPVAVYLDNNKTFIFKTLMVIGLLIQLPSVLVNSSLISRNLSYEIRNEILTTGFIPEYSPVIWGSYHIASAVSKSFGRENLRIPVNNTYVSFKDIDFWDIWYFNVFRIVEGNFLIKLLTIICILALILGIYKTWKKL